MSRLRGEIQNQVSDMLSVRNLSRHRSRDIKQAAGWPSLEFKGRVIDGI